MIDKLFMGLILLKDLALKESRLIKIKKYLISK
jgi:hypothetical protein